MSFIKSLEETLNEQPSITENGAVGYRTTGKELLDLNFKVSSLRNKSDQDSVDDFVRAFYENKRFAVKWLFFASDVREGLGERRLFRVCLTYLATNHKDICKAVLDLVPEYSRWDNLLCLLDTELCDDVVLIIKKQLQKDVMDMSEGKTISLAAKWMPSANTSSKETKRLAHILIKKLNTTEKVYRKMLSKLRAYTNVVEVSMSNNKWNEINYSSVPSRANLIYKDAFMRHDEDRRRAYLDSLQRGEVKINAGVLFPHDIVHKYSGGSHYINRKEDITIEELWKALPDCVQDAGNTICVADGSGSMSWTHVGNSDITCLDVANALAIYFSERSSGEFANKYITFSSRPRLVDLKNGNSLKEKLEIAFKYDECANTNIEAVFDLILQTAINSNMKQEELPSNILILSDMEFDGCAETNGRRSVSKKLFQEFVDRYEEAGYQLPRLVFWNICSRSETIPVKENDLGVALVSGFSPTICKMVLSSSTDPYECLLEQINSERYKPIERAIRDVI